MIRKEQDLHVHRQSTPSGIRIIDRHHGVIPLWLPSLSLPVSSLLLPGGTSWPGYPANHIPLSLLPTAATPPFPFSPIRSLLLFHVSSSLLSRSLSLPTIFLTSGALRPLDGKLPLIRSFSTITTIHTPTLPSEPNSGVHEIHRGRPSSRISSGSGRVEGLPFAWLLRPSLTPSLL